MADLGAPLGVTSHSCHSYHQLIAVLPHDHTVEEVEVLTSLAQESMPRTTVARTRFRGNRRLGALKRIGRPGNSIRLKDTQGLGMFPFV